HSNEIATGKGCDGRTKRSSEREPADSVTEKSKVIGGWPPSLTFAFCRLALSEMMLSISAISHLDFAAFRSCSLSGRAQYEMTPNSRQTISRSNSFACFESKIIRSTSASRSVSLVACGAAEPGAGGNRDKPSSCAVAFEFICVSVPVPQLGRSATDALTTKPNNNKNNDHEIKYNCHHRIVLNCHPHRNRPMAIELLCHASTRGQRDSTRIQGD